ncbi:hypothetical protein K461DRAFT_272522 [Myriangium duriaei CBS 260.36]|uniref:Cytoplasmic tRNA 2-thiolation protein 2 n=1 Tax=Myriangium duriaei CBS 260.36 TaxID=1168546 RepID=A0A9P4IQJ4_9PEZI|nr:hypothetical protein K461DRAFT_272522 [Myriangium duriaei CBS 260.36]
MSEQIDAHLAQSKPLRQCQRCRSSPATQDVRTQKLCDDCFILYIRTRPIKRIEAVLRSTTTNKLLATPGSEPVYLLSLSGGPTSLALLSALDSHITSMKTKTGRSSYALHALHISSPPPTPTINLAALRTAFPQLAFSSVLLSSALSSFPAPPQLTQQIPNYASLNDEARLAALLSRAASPTARADLESQLRARALTSFALAHGQSIILLGSSATALAELTLAETAKGRGGAVVAGLAEDGAVLASDHIHGQPGAGVKVFYPMRDLLRSDVGAYINVAALPGQGQEGKLATLLLDGGEEGKGRHRALKNVAIDELARTYFRDVEEKFPNIVHNVVRTVGKLDGSATANGGEEEGGRSRRRCVCCGDVVASHRADGVGLRDDVEGVRVEVVEGMCKRCERDFGVEGEG